MIKNIVFDVDDTLYEMDQPFYTAITQLFPKFPIEKLSNAYIRFRYYSDLTFPKVVTKEWTWDYMRFYRLNETLKDYGHSAIDEPTAMDFQAIYEQAMEAITLHPAIYQTLQYLTHEKYELGIITNGPTAHQLKKIKNLSVGQWVKNRIVVSQEAGYSKPEVAIFKIAEKRFNFLPEETLYIGDNYDNDIVGANDAGWQSIWLNHRHRKLPSEIVPRYNYATEAFEDLLTILKKL
ncbi:MULTISPECIES: HAD family hydrolase [unclassified Enterococcus]|uniref:HAD family hydrolase n=1 Tax=unclassified Enterococcus TaxID=2608891 RepID=UPI0015550F3C|nr:MULTISPECIES: HAD family hydrolase [unclassified Enterococcus]MBS7577403.1 HAD family hydrolase [Enterococcus sp. MMGLQ5-2]MBS7584810.1 HAD family hydrolase [Enterococcus sp. MMGLQ5-1]NPD12665.1 HAD family hydrolase [Enterococcus sp. MMGLQ5-1]NPD37237.1 HAD family hydrolase [Enterococcus sp. MMGLQ5-2]